MVTELIESRSSCAAVRKLIYNLLSIRVSHTALDTLSKLKKREDEEEEADSWIPFGSLLVFFI